MGGDVMWGNTIELSMSAKKSSSIPMILADLQNFGNGARIGHLVSFRIYCVKAMREAEAISAIQTQNMLAVGQVMRSTLSVTTTKVISLRKLVMNLPIFLDPWLKSITTS